MNEPFIITNAARCRDCYRCVRHCDVKAIRVQDGQAQVVPDLCIICGTCIRSCPQKAKDVQSSVPEVKKLLQEGHRVIASLAPSAPAYFDFDNFKPYNDRYGFRQGDRTILLFSDILKKTSGANKFFAGHIGGDDFFAGFRIGALDKVSIDNKIQRCIIRSLLK